jgi:hypothetical protein
MTIKINVDLVQALKRASSMMDPSNRDLILELCAEVERLYAEAINAKQAEESMGRMATGAELQALREWIDREFKSTRDDIRLDSRTPLRNHLATIRGRLDEIEGYINGGGIWGKGLRGEVAVIHQVGAALQRQIDVHQKAFADLDVPAINGRVRELEASHAQRDAWIARAEAHDLNKIEESIEGLDTRMGAVEARLTPDPDQMPRINIQRIEVACDDPDRFAFALADRLKRDPETATVNGMARALFAAYEAERVRYQTASGQSDVMAARVLPEAMGDSVLLRWRAVARRALGL